MPWPVRWMKWSPKPPPWMRLRATPSTSSQGVPTRAAANAAAWAHGRRGGPAQGRDLGLVLHRPQGAGDLRSGSPAAVGQGRLEAEDEGGPGAVGDGQCAPSAYQPGHDLDGVLGLGPRSQAEQLAML